MSLPPLPEGHERILGDVTLPDGPSGGYIPGDASFAALDALADRFNLAAFATRGSPAPTPRDILTHGASTSSSILRLSPEAAAKSSKMRPALARLVSDASLASSETDATLAKLCRETHKRPELRDELVLSALALARRGAFGDGGEDDPSFSNRAWDIVHCVCAAVAPTETFAPFVGEYLAECNAAAMPSTSSDAAQTDKKPPPAFVRLVANAAAAHKKATKVGQRRHPLTPEHFQALRSDTRLTTHVYFLDETFEELPFDALTTVADATPSVAGTIRLREYATFGLFAAADESSADADSLGDSARGAHVALADTELICDILQDLKRAQKTEKMEEDKEVSERFRNPFKAGNGVRKEDHPTTRRTPRLVFKKRMFRDTDESVTEAVFVSLSYLQLKRDFLDGRYPVNAADAAQLCALQIQAEDGPRLGQKEPIKALVDALPRFVPPFLVAQSSSLVDRELIASDVRERHRSLAHDSKEEARLHFTRLVRQLPYGGSSFFPVLRIEDPIGLLPGRIVLGVNKRGVHFFRPTPMAYLHSAELRDIMQFGSSENAVFFKMRVAGAMHVFQFETNAGEEVCVALQTHINDVMTKRHKEKKMKKEGVEPTGKEKETRARPDAPSTPRGARDGPSDPRVKGPTKSGSRETSGSGSGGGGSASSSSPETENAKRVLVAANRKIEEMAKERAALRDRLQEAQEAARSAERDGQRVARLEADLEAARASAAEAERRAAEAHGAAGETDERVEILSRRVGELTVARDAEAERARDAEAEARALDVQLQKLKADLEDARVDLTRSAEADRAALEARLEGAESRSADADRRAEALRVALDEAEAELERARAENETARDALLELERLRELSADVERRERQTADIIKRQRETVETLEAKYKEESALRKKYFNTIEDMKGKIRVFARTRPLSEKEKRENQTFSLSFPDAFTMEHPWRDERLPRSYNFDRVFGADSTQAEVFEDTKYLVQSAFDGYNVCIFAYGQTGSGKTHTVHGDSTNPGLAPRAVEEVCRVVAEGARAGKISVRMTATMLELYQDTLNDLLLPAPSAGARGGEERTPPRLDIKKDSKGWVTVQNATVVPVRTKEDMEAAISTGLRARATSATKMNAESSRSHLIFSLVIETTDLQTQGVARGKLSFVDLAGSERVKKSGAAGATMKEAQAINKSLSALGDVISALAQEKAHVPYRNHKLTMLMSDSLGGNAKTLMFVNVSPSDGNLEETQNSLAYATRVRTIKNSASKDVADKEMQRLRAAVASWRAKAGELGPETRDVEDRVQTEMATDAVGVGGGLPIPNDSTAETRTRRLAGGAGRLPNP